MGDRRWGPFSGAQLTVMVTTIALCISVPAGLWASAPLYSNFALYDPVSKLRAKVVKGGAVIITDGSGALTVDGAVSATVTGSVTATAAAPTEFYHSRVNVGAICDAVASATATKGLILTRVIVNTNTNPTPAPTEGVFFMLGTDSNACNNTPTLGVNPPDLGISTFELTPGLVIPPNNSLWAFRTGGVRAAVMGIGYFVPAAAVSSLAAAR